LCGTNRVFTFNSVYFAALQFQSGMCTLLSAIMAETRKCPAHFSEKSHIKYRKLSNRVGTDTKSQTDRKQMEAQKERNILRRNVKNKCGPRTKTVANL
jgi:hypothetical protein